MAICKPILNVLASESKAIDSGWSWLLLCGTFIITAYTWGVQHVVGIIYNVLTREFKASKTLVAWITSIPLFLLFFLAPLFAVLAKKMNGVRILGFTGALCIGLSLITSSFVENIYVLFFTYSFLMGIGMFLLATPIFIKTEEYFEKYKSSAIAFVTVGAFASPLYLSPLLAFVISKLSWRSAFQVLGVQVLFFCCPSVLLWRIHYKVCNKKTKETKQSQAESLDVVTIENNSAQQCNHNIQQSNIEDNKEQSFSSQKYESRTESKKENADKRNIFKALFFDKNFIILLIACFVGSLDWIVSHTHLVSYAIDLGIPSSKANWLPTFSATGNIIGRLLFGKLFDLHFIKTITFYKVLMFTAGVVSIFGAFGESFEYLAVYAVIQMLLDGGHKSQMPTVAFEIVGKERIMEGWTLIMFFQSFMLILGPSLVGILTDLTENYKVMFYFISGPPILASIILQTSMFLPLCSHTSSNLDSGNKATE